MGAIAANSEFDPDRILVDLASRATSVSVGELTISVASLEDIIASKRFAALPKDVEAWPEL